MPNDQEKDTVPNLLKKNEEWAKKVTEADPTFFVRSAQGPQKPQVSLHLFSAFVYS
jgi:hypothetical protein